MTLRPEDGVRGQSDGSSTYKVGLMQGDIFSSYCIQRVGSSSYFQFKLKLVFTWTGYEIFKMKNKAII